MDKTRIFGFLVKDVSRLHSKNFERLAVGLNLTLAQCKVLAALERHEGLSQVRLAEQADADPMTLMRIIDRMERDGWVERRADPNDRRARRLYLTDEAAPVIAEMWAISDRSRAQALQGLSAAERDQLTELLSRVQANLNAVMPGDESSRPAAAGSESRSESRSETKSNPNSASHSASAPAATRARSKT